MLCGSILDWSILKGLQQTRNISYEPLPSTTPIVLDADFGPYALADDSALWQEERDRQSGFIPRINECLCCNMEYSRGTVFNLASTPRVHQGTVCKIAAMERQPACAVATSKQSHFASTEQSSVTE